MVLTPSSMVPLGTSAPDFSLIEPASGEQKTLAELRWELVTVVIFMCNHCPFVVHIKDALIELANDLQSDRVKFVGINANDVTTHPDDAPQLMAAEGYPFPYLYDESQDVARAYNAQCTPDIFVYDQKNELIYRGQFDESRPGRWEATWDDLRNAIELALVGEVMDPQYPSAGCNVKWKAA